MPDTTLIITISDHATPSVRQRKLKESQNQNGVTLIRRLLGRKRRHKSKTKSTKHKTRKSLTRALRSTYDNANVNNNILNLSQIKLSQSQISLLGRGLTFVKTPRRVPLNEVLTAFSAFERRMHIQYHFRDHNSEKPTFYKKSNWDPPVPECTPIHDYLSCVQNDIRNLYTHPKQNPQNLTKNELEALNELKNNQNIVIKRADKGGKIVIWPREMYVSEASKQLSDTKYYHKLDKDQTGELALNIESFLFEITPSKNNINFLDTNIYINEIGQLESTIYKKPTDTCALLHRQSFHPEHTKTSVIFSQALRYRRVITKDDNLIQNLQKLRDQLLQRGYKFSEINSQFNKVLHYSQKQLLINKKQQQQHSNILPFVVPFDKITQSISSILKRHWHFINNEPRLKEPWPATPILSPKKASKLRGHLSTC